MRFDPALLFELARTLAQELSQAAKGHCLRVDFLNQEDAFELCHQLRQHLKTGDMSAYVLDSASVGHELVILPERAIEIRNRKEIRLCLIIPSGVVDAAASSLTNSFAAFDLTKFFKQTTETLVGKLPDEFKELHRQLKQIFRIALRPAPEHWADFVGALQQATSPAEAGCELWRLGLIPDAGPAIEDILNRLERNLRSVQELARPARAQASPEERLEKLHLKPGTVYTKLLSFFKGRRLRDSRGWLQEFSQPAVRGVLTFDQWVFEQSGITDLETITVEPFLDRDGKICTWTGLQQPGGPGTQPTIGIGPKSKVTVKWTCSPQTPSNLKNWQVEVIPSREEFSEEALAAETISTKVPAKTRRASIKLDFDPETYPARVVQIRVTGLDEHGNPLAGTDSRIIEGISTEFWFDEEAAPAPLAETRQKRDAVQTLPFGRLKVLAQLKIETLHEAPGQWEADETYFSITLNGQRNCRVEISPVLRKIEQRTIHHPEEGGCYTAHLDLAEALDAGKLLTPVDLSPLWQTDLGTTLLLRRKELFRLLQKQESRGLIETADWTPDLSERARSYAKAYREVLTQCDTPEILWLALRLDTIFLEINNNQETETAVLVQPTHPMRVLWYAAYVDLLGHWEKELGKLKTPRERQRQVDLTLIERVTPLNWPAFVLNPGGEIYLFAQNLHFFWALALPVGIPDPGRQAAQIARMVGFQEDEASLSDLPPKRIAAELNAYLGVHPYLKKLRLNAINPGSGGFLAEALREFYVVDQAEQAAETDLPVSRPHLEVIAHAHPPLPVKLEALTRLQSDYYESQPRGHRSHLNPLFSVAIRPIDQAHQLPGGDVNLSIAIDQLIPKIELFPPSEYENSASFYGLLVRFLPYFEKNGQASRWVHRLSFPADIDITKHPVQMYTGGLISSQSTYLKALSKFLNPAGGDTLPAVVLSLSDEQQRLTDQIHDISDWVVTLDRFFGVEFFDTPHIPAEPETTRQYLLDYAPEFLEGLGHRMLVTTAHHEEVEEILARAMNDLGFASVETSVTTVLDHLKTISGRLALRVIGDDAHAREAVSLGVVAAYLRQKGELQDSILIPVDAHPELFGTRDRQRTGEVQRARCDLVRVRCGSRRFEATFIEVKFRSSAASSNSQELMNRILDQIEATEQVFKDLFFRRNPERLDHILQRSRLVAILRFYLRRSSRYGLIRNETRLHELEEFIGKLEAGIPDLKIEQRGYIVNLFGHPQKPVKLKDCQISFLCAQDLAGTDLNVVTNQPSPFTQPPLFDIAQSPQLISPSRPEYLPPVLSEAPVAVDTPAAVSDHQVNPPLTVDVPVGEVAHEDGSEVASRLTTPLPPLPTRPLATKQTQLEHPANSVPPDPVVVELGETVGDQDTLQWKASVKGSPHLFILGIPGQGKSVTVTRLLTELAKQGLPALVVDFHGQFGEPDSPYGQIASPTVFDASQGLPFSPFEIDLESLKGTAWKTNCFEVAEVIQYVCELGDIQRDVVYESLISCYQATGFDAGQPERLPTIGELAQAIEIREGDRGQKNVLPRCRPLLEFGLFQDVRNLSTDFQTWLGRGLVVDLHHLRLETLQLAAGAFLLRKIYREMFHWGESKHLRLAIVLDEAHRLAKDITLPKIMKEGRKFGVAVIVASQGLADYHPDVVGNAGTKVIFRTNYPMSKKVAGFLRPPKNIDLSSLIEQLDVGEAFVQTPDMATCAQVRMRNLNE